MTDQEELLDIYGVPRTLRDAPPTIDIGAVIDGDTSRIQDGAP